jgi:hypothetical protein
MTAAAVQASAKHSDDLDYVLGQFFLEARWFAFDDDDDDDDLDVLNLALAKINSESKRNSRCLCVSTNR